MSEGQKKLVLSIVIELPDSATDEDVGRVTHDVVKAANKLHLAAGGGLLEVESVQATIAEERPT